jgi:hypothetical protein
LYEKILGVEEKRPERNYFLGFYDHHPSNVKTHEFSVSWIKYFVDYSQDYLRRSMDPLT